jgi:hypothetical protein
MKHYRVTLMWFVNAENEDMAILKAGSLGITRADRIKAEQEPLPSTLSKVPTGPHRED